MATTEASTERTRTRRETIDEMLHRAVNLALENNGVALRLRGILFGAPGEEQRPAQGVGERPARSGWLGDMADALELMLEHLEDTATVLEEASRQVAPQTPTPAAPRR